VAEQVAAEQIVIAELVVLTVELPDLVELVVDLNSDLFDFLPFLFYSRK
jgi:hypothetical protein